MELLTFFLSLAGAMAWIPYIWENIKRPKVFGVIKKYIWSEDITFKCTVPFETKTDIKKGSLHILEMNIICINKDLYFTGVDTNIKFKSDDKIYKGEVMIFKTFEQPKLNVKLEYNFNDMILSKSVMLKDKSVEMIIPILVNINRYDIEYIDLMFIKTSGKSITLRLNSNAFNGKEYCKYTLDYA